MLTAEQRSEFDERGFVRLRGAFSRAEAAAMEERTWAALERRHGVRRDDPRSWKIPLGAGLQPLRTHAVFAPIGGPATRGALDELIGKGRWQEPKHWGQFLIDFPEAADGSRRGRGNWHTDFPYSLPADRVVGALVLSFASPVPARGGGTLVIAGSPGVVARFVAAKPHLREAKMKVTRQALMQSDPWLKAVRDECGRDDWDGSVTAGGHAIDGIPVEVVELTGEPGDVVIGHPWLLHTGTPNLGGRPRFMRVQRIRASRID